MQGSYFIKHNKVTRFRTASQINLYCYLEVIELPQFNCIERIGSLFRLPLSVEKVRTQPHTDLMVFVNSCS